jgi:hypothetical protein
MDKPVQHTARVVTAVLTRAVSSGDMTLREAEAALAAERERAARLGAMLAARQQAADERLAALDRKVACLLGDAGALAACTASELEALEQVCTRHWAPAIGSGCCIPAGRLAEWGSHCRWLRAGCAQLALTLWPCRAGAARRHGRSAAGGGQGGGPRG